MKANLKTILIKLNNSNFLFVLSLTILTIMTGYTYGKHDQALYIPLINKILNPALYTRDAFTHLINNESASFFKLLSPFFRVVGVEVGFFILYITGFAVLILSSFLIGKYIFKKRNAGYVFALVVMASRMPTLSQETFFATRNLIIPLLLLAVYFFLKNKYLLSYFLIGILANFHQISSISLLVILGFVHLIFIKSIGIKKTLFSILVFIIGFSPTILQILSGNSTKIILTVDENWYKFQRLLTNVNYSIFYPEGTESTISFLATLFGSFIIFVLLRKYRKLVSKEFKQAYDKLSFIILFTIIFQIIVALIYRVYPAVILVQLQLIRASTYITIFTAFGLGALIYLFYVNKKINKTQAVFSFFLFYYGFLVYTALFLLLPIKKLIPKIIVFLVVIVGLFGFAQTFLLTRGYIPGQGSLYSTDNELIDLQLWMKKNTSVDSLFLAPTNIDDVTSGNIRVISERNILFTPSELWMNIIDYLNYPTIVGILDDISHGKATQAIDQVDSWKLFSDVMTISYRNLTNSDIVKLKNKYSINYFIAYSENIYSFKNVYSNSKFTVYKL
ncbi:MAG: hypothetical protein ABIM99_00650 [Candidatus Dojkabacteria bacterium]